MENTVMDWKGVYSYSEVCDHPKEENCKEKRGEKTKITTTCGYNDVWVIVVCGCDMQ